MGISVTALVLIIALAALGRLSIVARVPFDLTTIDSGADGLNRGKTNK
eukprot:COSAG01_NODE_2533_length_7491_cov_236.560741_5_plen_48_part_00